MCSKHVHSTVTRASRFHSLIGVVNKPTTVELWISPVYRRLAVGNFLSPQCKNCLRDPDHAHLGNSHHKTKTSHGRLRTKFEVSSVSRCGDFTWGLKF